MLGKHEAGINFQLKSVDSEVHGAVEDLGLSQSTAKRAVTEVMGGTVRIG